MVKWNVEVELISKSKFIACTQKRKELHHQLFELSFQFKIILSIPKQSRTNQDWQMFYLYRKLVEEFNKLNHIILLSKVQQYEARYLKRANKLYL